MEKYGLVKHYHSFIQASAEDKPLPNKLLFSDEEMPRETKAEVIEGKTE